jgi:site-specific DNA-methyltransferase (adenine-specific)
VSCLNENCFQSRELQLSRLDPFCGCDTTIDAAEKLGRDWIGIDVTQLAISLINNPARQLRPEI